MKKLHGVIHSLAQGEKRYVKIRLKGNKSSSLLNTYFDFIGKQKQYSFEGMSEIEIKNNLVIRHIDYWDSGRNFYCKIPFVGFLFRKLHK
mgnify:CR=1 FL=1